MDFSTINSVFGNKFGEAATYHSPGSTAIPVTVIRYQESTDGLMGVRGTSRKTVSFDIPADVITTRPNLKDTLTCSDADWFVKSCSDIAIDGMWNVIVERAKRS